MTVWVNVAVSPRVAFIRKRILVSVLSIFSFERGPSVPSATCFANCAPREDDYANAIEVPRAIALIDGGGRRTATSTGTTRAP